MKEKKNNNLKKINKKQIRLSKDKINDNKSGINKISIEYFKFYVSNLKRKHFVVYILSLIVFFAIIATSLNNTSIDQEISKSITNANSITDINLIKVIFTEKLPLVFVIIFAGITPFVYIPVLGFFNSYILAKDLVEAFYCGSSASAVVTALGCIIELFGISLSIATGIYYCGLSSKKFRYNQSSGYSMNDIKRNFYMATKKEDKLKNINEKIEEKNKKREKLNVKIPYKMLIISGIVSFLIVLVGTLITQGV